MSEFYKAPKLNININQKADVSELYLGNTQIEETRSWLK